MDLPQGRTLNDFLDWTQPQNPGLRSEALTSIFTSARGQITSCGAYTYTPVRIEEGYLYVKPHYLESEGRLEEVGILLYQQHNDLIVTDTN